MEFITTVYLILLFISMYMFFLFIILNIRNRKLLFDYPTPKKKYKVTVLTAGLNEEKTIEGTIKAVLDSDCDPNYLEMIVINDGSTDNMARVVKKLMKKYKNLKLIDRKENWGKSRSLNQGIAMAKGELIAVVDADSFPTKSAIKKLTGYFNDPKVGAATSAVFTRNKKNFLEKIQTIEYVFMAFTRKLFDFLDSVYVTNGPLSMYRKKALNEVGGFDPNSITEDIDVTWNILAHGYQTRMCLAAIVYTVTPSNFKPWWRQRVRWGIGGIQVIFKFRKSFLKKGMFGLFVIPIVSLAILLTILIFLFAIYLNVRGLFLTFLSTKYSVIADTTIIRLPEVGLAPSILFFFTIVLFVVTFSYSTYMLKRFGTTGQPWSDIKSIFMRIFYLIVYLGILYPIVWFPAIWRLIVRDMRWR